jgi:hypothetical protein
MESNEYNYEKGNDFSRYDVFSSTSDKAKEIMKNFSERELNQNISPRRLLEYLNEIPGLENKVEGFKIERDTDSLGKPRWDFNVYLNSPRENLKDKISPEKNKGKRGRPKKGYDVMPGYE